MTDISPTERQMFPLTAGRNVFLAGLEWKTLPSQYRHARDFARAQKADLFLACQYLSNEDANTHTMVATASCRILPGKPRQYLSLALLILPLLEQGGYAITELTLPGETPRYSFVSAVDGVLVSDLVGSGEEVREARDTFLSINTEPEQGWTRYEPVAFSAGDQNQALPLSTLTGSGKHPAAARLNPVSRGAQFITVSLIIALLGAAWYGWQYYERWKTEQAAQAAAARQVTEERISPPWPGLPETDAFIRGCADIWASLPLSAAGWRYSLAECSTEGDNGNLRASYTNTAGTTVTDFIRRISDMTGTRPFIVMPEGKTGGIGLPVSFRLPEHPVDVDALPESSVLQEQLTTLAQSMPLTLDWQEVSNSVTDENGNIIQPPWKEYDLQIQTLLPAYQLVERLKAPSVRFISVTRQLENGRFHYQFTGKYYAR
ncbi:type 4b pilus protein PilO2 [Escherichia coli]|nr:type 4b pilus protein PilO2 [Escherichia coli]